MERISAFGVALTFFGAPLAAFSFVVLHDTGLSAFGLACAVLGGATLLTPWTPVPEPPIRAMIEGSCINIEALLEEFDTRRRAIYLPPKSGKVYAYVPLKDSNPTPSDINKITEAPTRLITEGGDIPGLLFFPPGSELLRHSNVGQEMGIEAALHHVMVDFVEAVEGVRAYRGDDYAHVALSNPRVGTDFPRFENVLGSLSTSIAASVLALTLSSPITLEEENVGEGSIEARFKVLENG